MLGNLGTRISLTSDRGFPTHPPHLPTPHLQQSFFWFFFLKAWETALEDCCSLPPEEVGQPPESSVSPHTSWLAGGHPQAPVLTLTDTKGLFSFSSLFAYTWWLKTKPKNPMWSSQTWLLLSTCGSALRTSSSYGREVHLAAPSRLALLSRVTQVFPHNGFSSTNYPWGGSS